MTLDLPLLRRRLFVWQTLAALLGVMLALGLGRWQLSRAAEKENLQMALQAQKQLAALDTAQIEQKLQLGQTLQLYHRRVLLQGRWLPEHTVFLDNRQMQGKPGFFVFTPLQLAGTSTTLVVQRGWVPRNFAQRTLLPAVPTPTETTVVTGRLASLPSKLWEFGSGPGEEGASRIRQNFDWAQYSAQVGRTLALVTVIQTEASDVGDGLQRDWLEVGGSIAKHHGYAVQWFALAGLIAMLYVWFQWWKPLRPLRPVATQHHEDTRA